MKYSDKLKMCREINTDPIYKEYSFGIRCCCFKDINGNQYMQVMKPDNFNFLNSSRCNDWTEEYLLEWVMNATCRLKEKLGLFANPYDLF